MSKALSISLVLYHNHESDIKRLLHSLSLVHSPFDLFVIDNSADDGLRTLFAEADNFYYEHSSENLGFARGHNRILRQYSLNYPFHLIINPDVYFDYDVITPLIKYLEKDREAMQIIPRILNKDESIQFTYKIEPRPFDLFARRFLPKGWFSARKENLSKSFSLNGEVEEIPIMSGCFMFFSTSVLKEIGYLDERFFLYMEDIDFSKRISAKYKSVYYPHASIFHRHTQGSYKDGYLMRQHILSAIKYYNKHGWWPIF